MQIYKHVFFHSRPLQWGHCCVSVASSQTHTHTRSYHSQNSEFKQDRILFLTCSIPEQTTCYPNQSNLQLWKCENYTFWGLSWTMSVVWARHIALLEVIVCVFLLFTRNRAFSILWQIRGSITAGPEAVWLSWLKSSCLFWLWRAMGCLAFAGIAGSQVEECLPCCRPLYLENLCIESMYLLNSTMSAIYY